MHAPWIMSWVFLIKLFPLFCSEKSFCYVCKPGIYYWDGSEIFLFKFILFLVCEFSTWFVQDVWKWMLNCWKINWYKTCLSFMVYANLLTCMCSLWFYQLCNLFLLIVGINFVCMLWLLIFILHFYLFINNFCSFFLDFVFFFIVFVLAFLSCFFFIDFVFQPNLICRSVYLQWHLCHHWAYFDLFFLIQLILHWVQF
jgi:hypothetical protein